jgi:hypothetical protein
MWRESGNSIDNSVHVKVILHQGESCSDWYPSISHIPLCVAVDPRHYFASSSCTNDEVCHSQQHLVSVYRTRTTNLRGDKEAYVALSRMFRFNKLHFNQSVRQRKEPFKV